MNRHVKPVLGPEKLTSLTVQRIEYLRDAIANGGTAAVEKTKPRGVARVRGGEGAATRTLRTFSVVLNYAVRQGYIEDNPATAVRKTPDAKCVRFLSPTELSQLGKALRLRAAGPQSTASSIIRLLALTGCRRREIEGLRWSDVDLAAGFLRLSDSKTGAKTVYLPPAAAALLSGVVKVGGSQWVFPATSGAGHYQGTPKIWSIIREEAGLPGVRLHDLRHTFASQGLAAGASLDVLATLLGHKERRTTERYAHLAAGPVRQAADEVGSNIASLLA